MRLAKSRAARAVGKLRARERSRPSPPRSRQRACQWVPADLVVILRTLATAANLLLCLDVQTSCSAIGASMGDVMGNTAGVRAVKGIDARRFEPNPTVSAASHQGLSSKHRGR